MADDALTTLCRACGLCCDGNLFSFVGLEPGDEERLHAKGLATPNGASGQPVLLQRCAALQGRDCLIYESRPAHCARYQCLLAGALLEGEVTLEEAREVVNEAHLRVVRGHARGYLRQHFLGRHAAY
jgi:Fe-S-cluster containining protein